MYKKYSLAALVGLMSLTAILLVVGCSDNKSTNPNNTNTLSEQDQYDLVNMFLNLENDTTQTSITGLSGPGLALGLIDINYLDGVDMEDLQHITIPGLGKRIPLDPSSASVSIGYSNGWWQITVDSAVTSDGLSIAVSLIDSVRFEMLSGQVQETPDASTSTMRVHGHAIVDWDGTYEGGTLGGGFEFGSAAALTNLTSAAAMLNSSTSGTFGVEYQQGGMTANVTVGITGQTVNVTAPISSGLGCPNAGAISLTLALAATANDGETMQSANSTWTISGQVQEGGVVPYTIQSGTFTKSGTTDFGCD